MTQHRSLKHESWKTLDPYIWGYFGDPYKKESKKELNRRYRMLKKRDTTKRFQDYKDGKY